MSNVLKFKNNLSYSVSYLFYIAVQNSKNVAHDLIEVNILERFIIKLKQSRCLIKN